MFSVSLPSTRPLHHSWQDNGDCHPEFQNFSRTLNSWYSHSLVLSIPHRTFPHQRLCPAPCASLVISCLGYCNSLCGHTLSSPCNSSRTLQHASSSTSPDPPMLSPSCSPFTGCLCRIQNPAAGKQKGIHTCTPPGHCPGLHTPACSPVFLGVFFATTVHSACHFDSFPVWLLFQCLPYFSSPPPPYHNFCTKIQSMFIL